MLDLHVFAQSTWFIDLGLALPLVISICFVYAATRHEDSTDIVQHGSTLTGYLLVALVVGFAILSAMTWWITPA